MHINVGSGSLSSIVKLRKSKLCDLNIQKEQTVKCAAFYKASCEGCSTIKIDSICVKCLGLGFYYQIAYQNQFCISQHSFVLGIQEKTR